MPQNPPKGYHSITPTIVVREAAKAIDFYKEAFGAEEWLRFHGMSTAGVPRRSYTLTFDDGYLDAVEAARRHPTHHPQLFVPTAAVGRSRCAIL